MVAANQFDRMSVRVTEIETLVVLSPADPAFDCDVVRGQVCRPLLRIHRSHRESDMRWPGAIMWGDDSFGSRYRLQGRPLFKEQKDLVVRYP